MALSETLQKCKACDETVYVVDLLSADGVPYHKTCFKCSHCGGQLVISNYSSLDGVLYCKPDFEQLFKETGSVSKNFQTTPKSQEQSRTPSKASSMFSGTQDKCCCCHKTENRLVKLTVEGESYHKSCFKCSHGSSSITPSSFAALDGIILCKPHFAQVLKEKGGCNHLIETASSKHKQDQGPSGQTQEEQTADDEASPPDEAPPETSEQSS